MAVDVSTLSIKVVSSGIDDSTAKLDKLSATADKAEVATKKFSTSSSSSYQAVTKELQNLQRVANTTSIVPSSSGTAAAVAEIKMVTNAIANVGTQSKKTADESKNAFQAIGGSIANLRTLLGGGLIMGGLVGLSSSVIEMADSWKMMNARLKQVVGSSSEATKAQEELVGVALKLRVPLEGVVQLYTRAVPAIKAFGYNSKDALSVTTALSAALKASGATGAEASSVMLQFSQSLAAGRLNGAEFNAVAEGAPIVLRALEESLKNTNGTIGITRAELKKMGAEGTLDIEKIIPVMKQMEAQWVKAAESLPLTFDGAMTKVKTSFTQAIGTMDGSVGAVGAVAKILDLIANNAKILSQVIATSLLVALNYLIAKTAISSAAWVYNTFTIAANTRAQQIAAVTTMETSAASASLTAAQVIQNGVMAAGAGAVGLLSTALKFLGGPIGIITGLLTAGAVAWFTWGGSAADSVEKATDRILNAKKGLIAFNEEQNKSDKKTTEDRLKAVNEEIAANEKLIKQRQPTGSGFTMLGGMVDNEIITKQNALLKERAKLNEATAAASKMQQETEQERLEALEKKRKDQDIARGEKALSKFDIQGNWQKKADAIKETFGKQMIGLKEGSKQYEDLAAKMKLAIDAHDKLNPATVASAEAERKRAKELRASQAAQAADNARMNQATAAKAAYGNAVQSIKDFQDKLNKADEQHKEVLIDIHNKTRQAVDDINQKTAAIEAERKHTVLTSAAKIEMDALEKKASADAERAKLKEQLQIQAGYKVSLGFAQAMYDAAAARIVQIGDSTDASDRMAREQAKAQLDYYASEITNQKATKDSIDVLEAKTAQYEEMNKAMQLQAISKAMLDLENTGRSLGETLSSSFGNIGKSLGDLMTIWDSYNKQLDVIEQNRKVASKDEDNRVKAEQEAARAKAMVQAKAYADMASSAKGFFKEHTAGYKVMDATERAFRTMEMAMAAKSTIEKLGGIAKEIAAQGPLNYLKAQAAVLTQGEGDPYTAFARMAAMAAFVASIGMSIGGGGGTDTTSQDRQQQAGTGSVLGNLTAKSESISKSMDILNNNTALSAEYNAGMLASLKNIEAAMTGVASLAVKSGVTSVNFKGSIGGIAGSLTNLFSKVGLGGIVGKVASTMFGGKKTLQDFGITAKSASLGSVMSGGLNASQYTDIKKSGGWFGSDKVSRTLAPLSKEMNNQFGMVVAGLYTSVMQAGKALGMQSGLGAKLKAFVVDIGNISLKNLSAEDIQKQFSTIFSKIGDDLAKFGFGEEFLSKYQKVGEGAFETLMRVASTIATVDGLFLNLGIDVSTAFDSISMSGIDAKMQLIEFAGGLDNLSKSLGAYYDKYYTETEKQQIAATQVASKLQAMGITVGVGADEAATLANFRKQVELQQGMLDTESGRRAYTALLEIAPQFADVAGYLASFGKTIAAVTSTSSAEEIANADKARLMLQSVGFAGGAIPQAQMDAANAWWEAKGGPAAIDTQTLIADGITNINDTGAKDKTIADMATSNAANQAATIETLKQVVAQQQATNAILMAKIDSLTLAVAESGKRVVNAVVDTSTSLTR